MDGKSRGGPSQPPVALRHHVSPTCGARGGLSNSLGKLGCGSLNFGAQDNGCRPNDQRTVDRESLIAPSGIDTLNAPVSP
jgi:hypothetical protein